MGDYPSLPGWASCNHDGIISERERQEGQSWRRKCEARSRGDVITGFEDKGDHSQGMQAASKKLAKPRNDGLSPGAPRRNTAIQSF